MPFSRPPHLPYPNIWSRFTTDRGLFRIQDVTEDMREPAMELLTTHFTRDEPPCKYIDIAVAHKESFSYYTDGLVILLTSQSPAEWFATDLRMYQLPAFKPVAEVVIEIHKHPAALLELQKLWRNTLKYNISIACVVDDDSQPPNIVGVNVLTVVSKEDKEEPFQTEDSVWAQLFGAVDLVARSVDIFSDYGVDKYLTAYGLVVDPQWRGCTVGKELLLARIPLCKALDIKVTATVFTAGASQAVAKKAGFEDLSEITYEELANKGFVFPNIEKDTKTSKLMALVIN